MSIKKYNQNLKNANLYLITFCDKIGERYRGDKIGKKHSYYCIARDKGTALRNFNDNDAENGLDYYSVNVELLCKDIYIQKSLLINIFNKGIDYAKDKISRGKNC